MPPDLERRTYDVLRLIESHGPIGSIRLAALLRRRGYTLEDRTVRLVLSELDEKGLTEKVPGKGRRLTGRGRAELDRGDVSERLEQARARIATLTNGVTYDPATDAGDVATSWVEVAREDLPAALDALAELGASSLGPALVAVDSPDGATVRLTLPSSITLDGVLLSAGIGARLKTAGIVEYHPDPPSEQVPYEVDDAGERPGDVGGAILRYTDVLSDKESTLDVLQLLIEAGRTDVGTALGGDAPGLLAVDNREAPLTKYEATLERCEAVSASLGGVVDVRRPREAGPFPQGGPDWDFVSVTYGGVGENALGLLTEAGVASSMRALGDVREREAFRPVDDVRAEWLSA